MQQNEYKRIAKLEAITNAIKSNFDETLENAYLNACRERNEKDAAYYVREIRNRLLDKTDRQMTLDRIGLDASGLSNFINSFKAIISNEWAIYRQELRDLPMQSGFPFDVKFPISPDDKDNNVDKI